MPHGVVYGLYHPLTRELRYIGQTVGTPSRRLSGHLCDARYRGRARHLLHWVRSLLQEGLKPEIRILVPADSQEELDVLKMKFIADARGNGARLTNQADGGGGTSGRRMSEAHRAKLYSPEVVARMAATRRGQPSPRKGAHLSAESRAKISAGKKGNLCRFRADAPTADMLRLRSEGLSYSRIARTLGVSKKTVMNRVRGVHG